MAEYPHEKIKASGYLFSLAKGKIGEGTKIITFSDTISALMENKLCGEGGGC